MINTFGIKDDAFIRGNVPMTKEEVRVISLSKLGLESDDIVLDVGAGTGSISIEASFFCKSVYAIERKEEAVDLIHQNKAKFKCENLNIISDLAPAGFPDDEVNKVIIGGSGGKMGQIFDALTKYEVKRIVVNTITLENTTKALDLLKKYGYDREVVTVNIARSRSVGTMTMMMGQNPINIITGVKNED